MQGEAWSKEEQELNALNEANTNKKPYKMHLGGDQQISGGQDAAAGAQLPEP